MKKLDLGEKAPVWMSDYTGHYERLRAMTWNEVNDWIAKWAPTNLDDDEAYETAVFADHFHIHIHKAEPEAVAA